MKKDEIQVGSLIAIPGATLTRVALDISASATDDQLAKIGAALVGIEGARSWWIGDYGVAITERKGEHYTEGRAEALGIERGTFWNYLGLARFFPPHTRTYETLSHAHYIVAMGAAEGDLAVAQGWLDKAQAEELSVSQLRKAINVSKASLRNEASEAEENQFDGMDRADKWATTNRSVLENIDAETAQNLLEIRWAGVVDFIDQLRAKIGKR